MVTPRTTRIGGFVLNRARGCLEDAAGAERFLRPKSYRLLEVLSERSGHLVSKDDLIREVWPNVIVSDDSLAHCVSDIRRAFEPEGDGLVRTIPRRGYMLVTDGAEPAGTGRHRSIQSGLAAAVIAAAGVWWALPKDAAQVAPEAAEPAVMQADALLEARDWRRRGDNERARTLLETIVAGEPDNTDALASLALTYWLEVQHLAWGGGRREMAQALEKVERAIAIGGSARSHRLLAEMRLLAPFPEMRSPVDALANAQAAVAIDPDDPDNLVILAQVFALTGRSAEAVRVIEQVRHLDPTPPDWYRQVAGLSYIVAGDAARAVEEFGPIHGAGTFVNARWWPGWLFAASLAHSGRIDEAAAVLRAAYGRRPEQSIAGVAQSLDGFSDGAGLAIVLNGLRLAGMPG